ncbi:hypothetical protein CYLTODRAFT_442250 [Cylindrobasidium torrendii FP15055 ss-10]|uniref:Uncharacterized protein n=1 Tax=Cylindrobasidium torrendii FP15055 ss-10 TaxID=1314674 RepID=A0A0D7BIG9_9AGAR|nr:hypothetical protein CYLTODRAFT_442250 [Cylindrobasidium torrendii FP15055 ss-10]
MSTFQKAYSHEAHRLEQLRQTNDVLPYEMLRTLRTSSHHTMEILTRLRKYRQFAPPEDHQALLDKAAFLKTTLRAYDAVLTPIRQFPDDILSEIFEWCTHPDNSGVYELGNTLDPMAAPWTLSHVCRRWRLIALQSPRLWCNFNLDLDYTTGKISRRVLRRKIKTFLARSRGCDLHVTLGGVEYDDVHVLYCLEPASERCVTLTLEVTGYHMWIISQWSFPRLTELDVDMSYMELVHPDKSQPITLHRAPRLRICHSQLARLVIPWHQVVECSIVFGRFLDAERLVEMLVVEWLQLKDPPRQATWGKPPVSLPSLRALHIVEELRQAPDLDITAILDAPNINHLALTSVRSPPRYPNLAHISSLFLESGTPQDASHIVALLREAPTVDELSLMDRSARGRVLDALVVHNDRSEILLPRLKTLRISSAAYHQMPQRLLRLCKSRVGNDLSLCARLCTLDARGAGRLSDVWWKGLNEEWQMLSKDMLIIL